ncbi:hypothetical protein A3D77_02435 [Candidatus Gottesmanbacteria bacterium RIFCSPHIGHO2_02_FULL_39_11]|uniref:Glycosyltransferase RgtA/B/C/D-like domain-containing protein n=1 Tax=Candidatus Gottesmanbacteria bacterium RIFCSPHIGHO2_02_FULL_39_11 TaxID=1798382 RepID=A0A1F5ZV93_9BACT|nr:MAG: hypothetical protein A3D77_02435 [Candidatus Gottesmanbacteria bacterium RIFCSPHIGHO2_02_FULL_39_11]
MKVSLRIIAPLSVIILLSFFLFFPSFSTYFHQDDFTHMTYSDTFSKVISSFNLFAKGDFPFYRPIPTQVYFYFLKHFFGLNPFPYHAVNFILFILNILILYRLSTYLTKSSQAGIFSSLFYAVNSTHIAPLFSPAYCHELFLVFFGLLSVYSLATNKTGRSILFFILALMSKETAVVLPGILILTYIYEKKKIPSKSEFKKLGIFILLSVIYFLAHAIFYGFASSSSYKVIIGKATFQILFWYFLWALSVPNIFIDFLLPHLKISPVWHQVAGANSSVFFIFFGVFAVLLFFLMIWSIKYVKGSIYTLFYSLFWFVIALLPLIIFPLHKLATEQALALAGLSIYLGSVLSSAFKEKGLFKIISFLMIVFYLVHASNSILLARRTHWVILSARQAEKTLFALRLKYPILPDDSIIYFKNGEIKIPQYGSAKQIYQALGNGAAINILYNDNKIQSYFEDVKDLPPDVKKSKLVLEFDSSKFLGY